MVRKNDTSTIETQTSLAFTTLKSTSHPTLSDVTTALDHVTKLTGIGPATGTLILSIFDPAHVPFFQDEMYEWFFPTSKGEKLKYNLKEYQQLFKVVRPVLERLGCRAVELEQVAYVIGHVEVLTERERKELEKSFEGKASRAEKVEGEEQAESPAEGKPTVKAKTNVKGDLEKEKPTAKKGTKRAPKDEADVDEAPATKRRSQRQK
jgi:hypothetical protein